ncbi:DUF6193 family natural product biosynthesis protein [Streptomyces sp. NPDC000229]|uniref:DUF6193 family natural product biosynthesis protein n=1 Tax=Streptomyces sp. NPDC000229 TaxID=3154247 RepID=UPI003328CDD5
MYAEAHEHGSGAVVEFGELVEAAHAEPRLRQLDVSPSHWMFGFRPCTIPVPECGRRRPVPWRQPVPRIGTSSRRRRRRSSHAWGGRRPSGELLPDAPGHVERSCGKRNDRRRPGADVAARHRRSAPWRLPAEGRIPGGRVRG